MRYDFYHEVYVQCQEKNWLGQWKYKFAEVWVDGSWTIQLYKYPEYYSNSWSYNGSVSYLKASINPQTEILHPISHISLFCLKIPGIRIFHGMMVTNMIINPSLQITIGGHYALTTLNQL
jgi:hypothetical protein